MVRQVKEINDTKICINQIVAGHLFESNCSRDVLLHSLRVAELSEKIGQSLGLTKKERDLLKIRAYLHDVGKCKIPDSILNKPGPLTFEEREVVKKHSYYSEEIADVFFGQADKQSAKIIRGHHENFDGSGYPDGLKGEDILYESRIIAIADVFDAISSPRIYRKEPIKDVIGLMCSEAEKKFDKYIFDNYALQILKNETI